MTTHRTLIAALAALFILATPALAQSKFTYQGELNESGAPVDGTRTLRFLLYDDETNPTPLENLGEHTVSIEDGLFTVTLDTTDTFAAERFLEIVVVDTIDHVLAPRQRIDPAPRSIYSINTRGIHVTQALDVGINTSAPGAKLEVRRETGATEALRLTAEDAPIQLRLTTETNDSSIQSWNQDVNRPATLSLNPDGGLVTVSNEGIGFSDGSRLLSVPGPNLIAFVGSAQATTPTFSIFPQQSITQSVFIPDAQPGDIVVANPRSNIDTRLIIHAARVTSPGSVEFRITNGGELVANLQADIIDVAVLRP